MSSLLHSSCSSYPSMTSMAPMTSASDTNIISSLQLIDASINNCFNKLNNTITTQFQILNESLLRSPSAAYVPSSIYKSSLPPLEDDPTAPCAPEDNDESYEDDINDGTLSRTSSAGSNKLWEQAIKNKPKKSLASNTHNDSYNNYLLLCHSLLYVDIFTITRLSIILIRCFLFVIILLLLLLLLIFFSKKRYKSSICYFITIYSSCFINSIWFICGK